MLDQHFTKPDLAETLVQSLLHRLDPAVPAATSNQRAAKVHLWKPSIRLAFLGVELFG